MPSAPVTTPVAGIVLAGGWSRRMGADKAWLHWDGQPLLSHVAARLVHRCAPLVVVGRHQQALPPTPGARQLSDPPEHPDQGPLRGLWVALVDLASHGAELTFVSAGDAPFVSSDHVDALVAALTGTATAAVPVSDGRLQVLSSVVRVPAALAAAQALLNRGSRSLQALFAELEIVRVDPAQLPDARALRTCNTPRELADLRLAQLHQP